MLALVTFTVYASFCHVIGGTITGILYPRESESRSVKSLDGIWNFRLNSKNNTYEAYNDRWYSKELRKFGPVIPMPVPASYNDITVEKSIRDNIGVAWYDRKFFVPTSWGEHQRVWIRFGSVCYAAQVWINSHLVLGHEIGHLPFKQDITDYLNYGQENLITVAVDNVLLESTIPQGVIGQLNIGNKTILHQYYAFDFFNYAGIDRPVLLYTTPEIYIEDITVQTDISHGHGFIYYQVDYNSSNYDYKESVSCNVTLYDRDGEQIKTEDNCSGKIIVNNAKLWWPYLMHSEPGYLYQLKVEISDFEGSIKDVYRLPVGIRKLTWNHNEVKINGRPIYIRGVGKHEDFYIKGKGLDLSVIVRDFDIMKWMGVNTFRTSHYPYAEEIMDMADSLGIMVIDEAPSVDTEKFSSTLLLKHKRSLTELFQRDKNRPSVIMWSVANEPRTNSEAADTYFEEVVNHIKSLDSTRPVTAALAKPYYEDKVGKHMDVIAFNRYNSWYNNPGVTEIIYTNVIKEAERWYHKHKKPVLMSEYGADTLSGMHFLPESLWSEDYQSVVLEEHFKAFDYLRHKGFFMGEMIWNFADFQTAQTPGRAGGNKKGILTRERQPKAAAHLLRKRYHELAKEIDGATLPGNLVKYTSSANATYIDNF